jgi:ubiquitin carboxyl-terminal hydrolase 10
VQVGQYSSSEASQQVLLEALPAVLVLHLKRFLYDAEADVLVKISKPVKFAPELEIPIGTIFSFVFPCYPRLIIPRCSVRSEIMAPVAGKAAESAHYKLYGVLYHHGKSASSGHYTVDVLHPYGDGGGGEAWLHIDDEVVSAERHEDVFGRHSDERADGRCAYMLFYRRTAFTRT